MGYMACAFKVKIMYKTPDYEYEQLSFASFYPKIPSILYMVRAQQLITSSLTISSIQQNMLYYMRLCTQQSRIFNTNNN